MKQLFFIILALALALPATGQGNFYTYSFTVDTLTNTDNGTFTLPITFKDEARYSFQINAVQISGTTAANAYLQASNDASGTDWADVDTLAISGSSSGFLTGSTISPRLRIYVSQTGTSSTKYNIYVVARKRND